jgi:hypothetical protein
MSTKVKFFHLYGNATAADGKNHVVTIVGKLSQSRKLTEFTETIPVEVKPGSFLDGELKFKRKLFNRKLTLGMSICHPLDVFDVEKGVEVAKSRIEKGETIGELETSDVTMLTDDAIMAELLVKLAHVTSTVDDYLP